MTRKKTTVYVFIDTNILVHFRYFDEIDWPALLQYREVRLVVAPIILTELEELKYDRASQRRRERARKVSKGLEEAAESAMPGRPAPVPGRAGVTLLFLTDSPNVTGYPGLQDAVQDDQLLASLLSFMENHPDIDRQDVILVSDDAGLLVKARARSITVRRLDDSLRLDDEPSKDQQEIRRLERELAELKSREPILKLTFRHTDGPTDCLRLDLAIVEDLSEHELDEYCRIESEATVWPRPRLTADGAGGSVPLPPDQVQHLLAEIARAIEMQRRMIESLPDAFSPRISDDEIERYEHERQAYLEEYRAYLSHLFERQRLRGCSHRVGFIVQNGGTQPARGVKVQVVVPDAIVVDTSDERREPLRQPGRPIKPRTRMELTMQALQPASTINFSSLLMRPLPDVRRVDPDEAGPKIMPFNSTLVSWERTKVMHGLPLPLTELRLTFPAVLAEQTYELKYQLYADNLVKPAEETIRIVTRGERRPFKLKSPPA